tara:strand:+ start:627 stop:1286 length:660 start_codon:yes stop_codon:yes gene_type:complete
MFNTVKEAWNEVGGLSKPSKMPSFGYSLSAYKCKVGSRLRKILNSTCANCYALKGRYVFPNVQEALDRRMDKLMNNPKWVDAMVFLILWYCDSKHYTDEFKVFRWHDSGDIQSLEHLLKIVKIAERTPNVKHWLPTREVGIIRDYKKLHGDFPSNLVVRISATMVNGVPHKFHEHSSTVATSHDLAIDHLCPAPKQNNKCGDCRACWDINVKNVTYLEH